MWHDIAKTSLEVLKLAPRYFIAITLLTGLLLFLPDGALEVLGVQEIVQSYRAWLGIAFLVSGVLFLVDLVARSIEWLQKWRAAGEKLNKQRKMLGSLTEDEKKILRYYLGKETKTNVLYINDGVVNALVSAGIIRQAHMLSVDDLRFAFNISEFAWQHLHEHKELLEGSTTKTRTDQPSDGW